MRGIPRMEILYHSVHYLDTLRHLLGDPRPRSEKVSGQVGQRAGARTNATAGGSNRPDRPPGCVDLHGHASTAKRISVWSAARELHGVTVCDQPRGAAEARVSARTPAQPVAQTTVRGRGCIAE